MTTETNNDVAQLTDMIDGTGCLQVDRDAVDREARHIRRALRRAYQMESNGALPSR
jgi:hypothetical protein